MIMTIKRSIKKILPTGLKTSLKKIVDKRRKTLMLQKFEQVQKFPKGTFERGINLIGDIKAETGLGQSMRIVADIIDQSDIPYCIYQFDSPGDLEHNDGSWQNRLTDQVWYGINLLHINPSEWANAYRRLPMEILAGRYNIAFWLWELEKFPCEWTACIETVDEIWTPSEFISDSIRKVTRKPVITLPYKIDVCKKDLYQRNYFNLPEDKFLFLIMYDFQSISQRKNPESAVRAFKQAFPKEIETIGLIIKINHMGKRGKDLKRLKKSLKNYKNIYYITHNLSRNEVDSLISTANVFISLHRSEGFGLPMAEAMSLGVPVIATNWSANTEFMDIKSACLVDYNLIPIKKSVGPYKKGNRWADPDIAQAAGYMRKLASDKRYCETLAENGKKTINSRLNSKPVKILVDREETIYNLGVKTYVSAD